MEKDRSEVIQSVEKNKMIAILRKVPTEAFGETVEALYQGGVRLMEVTFDQTGGMPEEETLRQIRYIADHYTDVLPGAGTVLTVSQVEKACRAGARYIISPNVDEGVIRATVGCFLVSIPGALTPTEAVNAHLFGADFVKIFPVGRLGSGYIKDISAPLSHIRFLAVGGIDEKNMREYLDAGCHGVGVGSCLVNKKMIAERRFDDLKKLAEEYTAVLREA